MPNDPVVIVSAVRTPMGGLQGVLKDFAAPELGANAIRAAVERAAVKPEQIDEVIMGCRPVRGRHRRARLRSAPACRSLPVARRSTRCAVQA
jgi:acetyl-CoA C-acetyltransferase